MRFVTQNSRTGVVTVPDVPAPQCRPRTVLVQTRSSLISAGTEAAMLRFGRQSLFEKARSRPDLVKQVLRKVQADGLAATYHAVQERLDVPTPMGYSCAGLVLEVGAGAPGIEVNDRVACAGAGHAAHAEVVVVPKNLVVRIPDNVSYEEAAFGTTGAIALQGLRVGDVRVGERVVVLGLGLIGLLTVQLLKAAGCIVLGADPNPARARLALDLGANEAHQLEPAAVVEAVEAFTRGRGADSVIITAATESSQPVELAGEISRHKGRVVVVGQVGMNVPRRTYYHKELELRLSMSYGPGRYDPDYEEHGHDYPYAYVPFTEQRNLETFLQMLAEKRVTPSQLITHRFPVEEADQAYALVSGATGEPYLGVTFTYPEPVDLRRKIAASVSAPLVLPAPEGGVRLGLIGAGQYAREMLLPQLRRMKDVKLVGVGTSRGLGASDAARRFGFEYATTDIEELLSDSRISVIAIATRHDTHASIARSALEAGKHVFVEKPLATTEADLERLIEAAGRSGKYLQVGFNRRFSPLIQKATAAFAGRTQPLAMIYRVNAGAIAATDWHQDSEEGGGRIVGEGCHFIDLMQFFSGSAPVSVHATSVSGGTGAIPREDIVTITVRFADGSLGTLHYFANGDKAIPKESLEIFGGGKTFLLDDFRRARFAAGGKVAHWKLLAQDKGQRGQLRALMSAITTGAPNPVPLHEAVLSTLTTFRALDSLRLGREVPVDWARACAETLDERVNDQPLGADRTESTSSALLNSM